LRLSKKSAKSKIANDREQRKRKQGNNIYIFI
jgi:hypothetical protein